MRTHGLVIFAVGSDFKMQLICSWLGIQIAEIAEEPHAVAGCRVCRNWSSRQAQPLFWHFCSLLTLLRNFNSLTLDISASVTVSNVLTHTKYLLVTHSNFTGDHFLCTGVTLQLSDTKFKTSFWMFTDTYQLSDSFYHLSDTFHELSDTAFHL